MAYVRKADLPLVERIKRALDTNAAAVERAMILLGDRQSKDELEMHATLRSNKQGFSLVHAEFGARVYAILKAGGHLQGRDLSIARHIAKRYASTQLLQIAKDKEATANATDQTGK